MKGRTICDFVQIDSRLVVSTDTRAAEEVLFGGMEVPSMISNEFQDDEDMQDMQEMQDM